MKAFIVAATFAIVTLAGVVQASEVAPKAPDQSSEIYGDWTVRCVSREGLPPCDMVQFVTNGATKEQVMRFSIAHSGQADRFGVQIQVPLGVSLSGGVLVRIDDKENVGNFQFTRCEVSGCFIESVVSANALEPFRRAQKGVIAIRDRQGKPMVMPLSFKGFVSAMDVMSKKNISWASSKPK